MNPPQALLPVVLCGSLCSAALAQEPAPLPPPPGTNPAPALVYPHAVFTNRWLRAHYYLPDATNGYYRGTRFDWSGLISRVESGGHSYFAEFRQTHDPLNHDDICGTAEEFDINDPPGYKQAKPGEPFLKIGVGVLERPDDQPYTFTKTCKIIDGGAWTVTQGESFVVFRQVLAKTGRWAYDYAKIIQFHTNSAVLSIRHEFKNNGIETLSTLHYGHNFLKIDDAPAGPGYQLEFPFNPQFGPDGQAQDCLTINNKLLLFTSDVAPQKPLWTTLRGFASPGDHRIIVRNTRTRGAVTIMGDRALERLALYSSNGVLCPEPFVRINAAPGQIAKWTTTYVFGE